MIRNLSIEKGIVDSIGGGITKQMQISFFLLDSIEDRLISWSIIRQYVSPIAYIQCKSGDDSLSLHNDKIDFTSENGSFDVKD